MTNKITALRDPSSTGIEYQLKKALAEHEEFDAVLVIARLIGANKSFEFFRMYSSDLSRLEQIGILEEAKDRVLHPED